MTKSGSRKKWRDEIGPIVEEVVLRVGVKDPVALRAALRQAYPYGNKLGYRYRAWLAEITKQIGGMRPRKDRAQLSLFDDE